MDITKNSPTVVAFCAGYGGIERGLDLAGVKHRVLTYVEIEAFACANLVAKMETNQLAPAPIWTDLKTFPAQIFRDKVDILTGGYPCQPFSAAGKRAGKDDPRHLWPHIRRHIESIGPVRCFFENVDGHISLGLREVIEDLESLGYATTWGIFSASEVGAPHQRKRVYILADSNDAGQQPSERQGQARHDVGGRGAAMADADSVRHDGRPVSDEIRERALEIETQRRSEFYRLRGEAEGRSDDMANADSSSRRRGAVGGPQGDRESELHGSEELADANSQGLEGRLYGSSADSERRQEQEVRRTAKCSDRGSRDRHQGWASEPELGRVVDGCADRVDRLRLLGNGVVPQTAAKAWAVLNNQL